MQGTFGRQALPIVWDYCEANPFGGSVGSWKNILECVLLPFDALVGINNHGTVACSPAQNHPLPDDSVDLFCTDPPYYDAVPYADLSDFFYVWLKRMLLHSHGELFKGRLTPKMGEIVQLAERNQAYSFKTKKYFEELMCSALREGRRITTPHGIGVVVFAHKDTNAWETILNAIIEAGWIITASWPIDTEMGTRLRAINSATLGSSIHLVCRPRENIDGSVKTDVVGDWRDVQADLPIRIHDWMPRLAAEGVVGADAIFACLGPALEIFSRYSRVERADGTQVMLKDFLERVWAAVSQEALSMIFADADAAGLDPEARLTAMWLWTVNAGKALETKDGGDEDGEDTAADDDDEPASRKGKTAGYALEFDAARKIAQGLGIDLEKSQSVVEVKGDTARLLPVAERAAILFAKSKQTAQVPATRRKAKQLSLIATDEISGDDQGSNRFGDLTSHAEVTTVLDRLHQAMILFAASRGEAMRRLLVDDGAGKDPRFWKLAQSLSALYPQGSEERRWVEGVMARKKGLGL